MRIAGELIHLGLSTIVRAMAKRMCTSIQDPRAVAVLRDMGGFHHIIQTCTESVLRREAANPRASPFLAEISARLETEAPTLRERLQALLSQVRLVAAGWNGITSVNHSDVAGGLRNGSYSEVELHAREIGWKGRADLISISRNACEILDFKTGRPKPDHEFQIRLYALLWKLDESVNPDGRRADSLGIIYSHGRTAVPAPTDGELLLIKDAILSRAGRAVEATKAGLPAAKTDSGFCIFCDMRQLCDEYWDSLRRKDGVDSARGPILVDAEIILVSRAGPRSWRGVIEASVSRGNGTQILVRNASRNSTIQVLMERSHRLRILRAAFPATPRRNEEEMLVLNATSEVFVVP